MAPDDLWHIREISCMREFAEEGGGHIVLGNVVFYKKHNASGGISHIWKIQLLWEGSISQDQESLRHSNFIKYRK